MTPRRKTRSEAARAGDRLGRRSRLASSSSRISVGSKTAPRSGLAYCHSVSVTVPQPRGRGTVERGGSFSLSLDTRLALRDARRSNDRAPALGGGHHGDGFVALALHVGGGFGCRAVALPGEVDDGRGVKRGRVDEKR